MKNLYFLKFNLINKNYLKLQIYLQLVTLAPLCEDRNLKKEMNMKKLILLAVMFMAVLVPHCVKALDMPFNLDGFYVSGNASCNFLTNSKKHHAKLTFEPGYLLAPAIGYRFCNGIRLEAEFAYRRNENKKAKYLGFSHRIGGHLETFSGLANVYYDLPVCWYVKPYVGVGIGYAYSDIRAKVRFIDENSEVNSASLKGRRDGFAWQAIAGVTYPLCDNIDVAVEYRFFQNVSLKRAYNNDIGATLRYFF